MKAAMYSVIVATLLAVAQGLAVAQTRQVKRSDEKPATKTRPVPVYVVPVGEFESESEGAGSGQPAPVDEVRAFKLERVAARECAELLRSRFPGVQIVENSRENSIIVVANRSAVFEEIQETLQSVDGAGRDDVVSLKAVPDRATALAASPALAALFDDPAVRGLLEELGRHEVVADSLASELREHRRKHDQPHPNVAKLQADLEKALTAALDVKVKLELLQVELLERRVAELKAQIEQRRKHSKQVVQRRVQALLEGDVRSVAGEVPSSMKTPKGDPASEEPGPYRPEAPVAFDPELPRDDEAPRKRQGNYIPVAPDEQGDVCVFLELHLLPGRDDDGVEVRYLPATFVSADGLLVVPVPGRLIEPGSRPAVYAGNHSVRPSGDTPFVRGYSLGTASVVATDEERGLTLLKIASESRRVWPHLACRTDKPAKGLQSQLQTQLHLGLNLNPASITEVGRPYPKLAQGSDAFVVSRCDTRPMRPATIGEPYVSLDGKLLGVVIQPGELAVDKPEAGPDEVRQELYRDLVLPALHIQKLIDSYRASNPSNGSRKTSDINSRASGLLRVPLQAPSGVVEMNARAVRPGDTDKGMFGNLMVYVTLYEANPKPPIQPGEGPEYAKLLQTLRALPGVTVLSQVKQWDETTYLDSAVVHDPLRRFGQEAALTQDRSRLRDSIEVALRHAGIRTIEWMEGLVDGPHDPQDLPAGVHVLPNNGRTDTTTLHWSGPQGLLITLADLGFELDEKVVFDHGVTRRTRQLWTAELQVKYAPVLKDAVLAGRLELHPTDARVALPSVIPLALNADEIRAAASDTGFVKVAYFQSPKDVFDSGVVEFLSSSPQTPGIEVVAEAARRGTVLAVLKLAKNRDSKLLATTFFIPIPSGPPTRVERTAEDDGLFWLVRSIPVKGFVARVACSPDGKRIAAAIYDGTQNVNSVAIVDVEAERTIVTLTKEKLGLPLVTLKAKAPAGNAEDAPLQDQVTALEFSPDGQRLAIGTLFGQVKIVDAQTGKLLRELSDDVGNTANLNVPPELKSLKRAIGIVSSLAFSPDGKMLAVCGASLKESARMWNTQPQVSELVPAPRAEPGRMKVWDFEANTVTQCFGHSHVSTVSFSFDGSLLASAGNWEEGSESVSGVIVWDPESGNEVRKLKSGSNGGSYAVHFAPHEKHVVTASAENNKQGQLVSTTIRCIDAHSGKVRWEKLLRHYAKPCGFLADHQTLAVLTVGDNTMHLLDVATGEESLTYQIERPKADHGANWVVLPNSIWLVIAPDCDTPEEGRLEIRSLNEELTAEPAVRTRPRVDIKALRDEEVEAFVLDTVRTPFEADDAQGSWQDGWHDTQVLLLLGEVRQQDRVIKALLKIVDHSVRASLDARRLAMSYVGDTAPQQVVPLLIKELEVAVSKPAKDYPYHEITALGEIGEEARDAIPVLIKLLSSVDSSVAQESLLALVQIGPTSTDVMNAIAQRIGDPNKKVVWSRAVYEVARYGALAKPLGPTFVRLLECRDQEAQVWAAFALVKSGYDETSGFDVLMQKVAKGPTESRRLAATALAALGHLSFPHIDRLRPLANDPDSQVASAIHAAIQRIEKDDRIFTHAEVAAKKAKDRKAAKEALSPINHPTTQTSPRIQNERSPQ